MTSNVSIYDNGDWLVLKHLLSALVFLMLISRQWAKITSRPLLSGLADVSYE